MEGCFRECGEGWGWFMGVIRDFSVIDLYWLIIMDENCSITNQIALFSIQSTIQSDSYISHPNHPIISLPNLN